jgi:hypothetical protein
MCPLVEGAVQVEKNRTIIADSFHAVNDRAKRVAPTIHVVLAQWRAVARSGARSALARAKETS